MNNAIPIKVSEDGWGVRGEGPEPHAHRLPHPPGAPRRW